MTFRLYNTLTRRVEDFQPINGNQVNMFVCGPTVYDLSHIGHAKTYIQLDVLARSLRQAGFELTYLQNITDIDDKIIARAAEQGTTWDELRTRFEDEYKADMTALNNTSVDEYARATDFIADIIRQVQTLLDKEYAYQIDDGIYFEVSKFDGYGKLSGRQEVKQDDAQSRIDQSEQKRGWNDFCLWKFSRAGEPTWDAPFGAGRPGWHIEDTAITEHFFGPQYDIHGGAVDLIFPHHEAELTQMEATSGLVPFVRFWVHAGFLNINKAKMSKSKDNFLTIREVLAKNVKPDALRLFFLQGHYRSSLDFSWDNLEAASNRLRALYNMASLRFQPTDGTSEDEQELFITAKANMTKALGDDLNTPEVLKIIAEVETALAGGITKDGVAVFEELLSFIDQTLGLRLLEQNDITSEQKQLLSQREKSRVAKDFVNADKFRGELLKQGIELKDTPSGVVWQRS